MVLLTCVFLYSLYVEISYVPLDRFEALLKDPSAVADIEKVLIIDGEPRVWYCVREVRSPSCFRFQVPEHKEPKLRSLLASSKIDVWDRVCNGTSPLNRIKRKFYLPSVTSPSEVSVALGLALVGLWLALSPLMLRSPVAER